MPSIIPGYVYSLFAALIVGSIVVYSCSIATLGMENQANKQQLSNIDRYVAAQGLSLLSHTTHENQNSTQYLDIPTAIGNQRFWIQIINDSRGAYVESGFGATPNPTDVRVEIPAGVVASGSFVSGSGRPLLQCRFENQVATLTLTMGD
jgi:hypothetical protein